MSYGSLDTIRFLLDIEPGEEDEKISKYLTLANKWIGVYTASDVLADVSSNALDVAADYYTVYLMRLALDRFSGTDTEYAVKWRDEAEDIIQHGLSSEADIFKIKKVNDEEATDD